MKCRIKQYFEISQFDWDNFVMSNSMGWAHLLYDVIHIDWCHSKNLSFAVVDADDHDAIQMIVQLYETDNYPIRSKLHLKRENLFSRWGYVLKDGLGKKQIRQVKLKFTEYIDAYISSHRIKLYWANLPPLSEKMLKNDAKVNPLIYFNFSPGVRYTGVIDLSKSYDKILSDCEETTRQAIRKLEKLGLYQVTEAKSTKIDFDIYVKLHKETYVRTHAEHQIIGDRYHENMFFNWLPKKICRIFFLKNSQTNETIASMAILIYRNTAYYWWGSSRNDKEVGVNKFLMFKIVCLLKKDLGSDGYFETGGIYPELREGKFKGLSDFKKSFGVFLLPIYCGNYVKK